ncbi:amylase cluster transcriptional regulator AmyR [Purpureocillium lavendulum]|uniref:Amylase cluster transcriptional regulator AmyR n=1 Tax=Purpureocillium lavendulum TaxID=1247861 RepID=A0AB34FFL3_9HYPO|nr:amylase cluster transcriptional regulator AmyR [Purpureocillium lavendulum]
MLNFAIYQTRPGGSLDEAPGQACDQCRQRKSRCDRHRPVCSNCDKTGSACTWMAVPKRRGPRPRNKRRTAMTTTSTAAATAAASVNLNLNPAPDGTPPGPSTSSPSSSAGHASSADVDADADADAMDRFSDRFYEHIPLTAAGAVSPDWTRPCVQSPPTSSSSASHDETSNPAARHAAAAAASYGTTYVVDPLLADPSVVNIFNPSPSYWSCVDEPFQLPRAFFEPYVRLFIDRLYPIFPVLDCQCLMRLVHADQGLARPLTRAEYALLTSLSAGVVMQLNIEDLPGPASAGHDAETTASTPLTQSPSSAQFFASQCLQARQGYSFIEEADEWTVMTSFFLFAYYGNLDQSRSAWYYLREAIGLAQSLGVDDPELYADWDTNTQQRRLRLFWLLFITERAYAIQHRRQVILRPSIDLPKVFDSHDPKLIYGFVALTKVFKTIDNDFIAAWSVLRSAKETHDPGNAMKKILEQEDLMGCLSMSEIDETQRLDVLITQQWLRVLVCKMQIRRATATAGAHAPESGQRISAGHGKFGQKYVLETCSSLLEIISKANQMSLEAHGIGMEQKISDAANCLCDTLSAYKSASSESVSVYGAPDMLHNFLLFLSRFRNHESQYLGPLAHKANLVLTPRFRSPDLPLSQHPAFQAEPELLHDHAARVAAKEDAAREGLSLLRKIASRLDTSAGNSSEFDISSWQKMILSLEQQWESFRYLVGTGGDTGVGKSSLINQLICDTADIVPTSQNGACTAAVCCFEYPKTANGPEYSAKISLKSKDTVDQELTAFFQEFQDFFDRVDLEGFEDSVTRSEKERFIDQLRLISSWSGLTEEQLRNYGQNNLASDISLTLDLQGKTPREFLLAVKPYVGSVGRQKPIAKSFYSNLDQLLVVTHCDRALDNRTAMELIRDDQIVDMEAECKINSNSLGVVVTKVDQMNWQTFLESEWPSTEVPAELATAADQFDEAHNYLAETEAEIKRLEASLRRKADGEKSAELQVATVRRQRQASKKQQLETYCVRECIEARSQDTKLAFQRYFDTIFSVSSLAQRRLAKGEPMGPFPDEESTGFTALKNWIIKGSLPKREAHADNILQRCQILLDAVDGWAAEEGSTVARLHEWQMSAIAEKLSGEQALLKSEMNQLTKNVINATHMHHKNRKLSNGGKIMTLKHSFVKLIDNFEKGTGGNMLHWSTYAACIRRRGGAFRTYAKPCKTHFWQARSHGHFWGPYALPWVQAAVNHHIAAVSQGNMPTEYRDIFRARAYKIETILGEHRVSVDESLRQYRTTARQIRASSREKLNAQLADAYIQAQAITGKGKKRKQAETLRDHAKRIKDGNAFSGLAEEIDEEVKTARIDLAKELKGHATKFVDRVSKFEDKMAREICSLGKKPTKKSTLLELVALKASVRDDIQAWQSYWTALKARLPEPEIPADEDPDQRDGDVQVKAENSDHQQMPIRSVVPKKRSANSKRSGASKKAAKKAVYGSVGGE